MKVFVAGGTGFVGRHLVRSLLEKGHEVFLGVRNISKAYELFGDKVKAQEVDFSDRKAVSELLKTVLPDAVINLIGILYEEKSKGITFEKVHYLYTVNLADASEEVGVKKFLQMSALGTDDLAPSRYHQTKRWAEKHLEGSKLDYAIFRPSIIIGPEQKLFPDMDKITRIIPIVALPGGGSYLFQPVDVRDVVEAFVKTLEGDISRRILHLCGPERVSFKKLLQDIFSFWNRKVLLIPLPKRIMFMTGKIAEALLEPPPFSSDQILMMWKDNVCERNDLNEVIGRDPISYEESLRWALENYSKGYTIG